MSKTALITSMVTSRDPKGRQSVSVFEAAYNSAKLDDDRAQRLNENGGELKSEALKLIERLSATNLYASEEVRSSYTYPSEYKGPKSVTEQVELLLKHLPGLDPEPTLRYVRDVYSKLQLPSWVEGPFVFPAVSALARLFFPKVEDSSEQDCAAVSLILARIAASRTFCNYREGQITPNQYRVSVRTKHALGVLAEMEQADILVAPGQFGLRHRGCSVRRAR